MLSQHDQFIEKFYFDVTDLWKKFCEEHNELFGVTCEEYSLLLSSDIESLDECVKRKEIIIGRISDLEKKRKFLIKQFNDEFSHSVVINSAGELVRFLEKFENKMGEKYLSRFNLFLIDIIQKLQDQNKKNQIFLNKAVNSLREVREEMMGKKSYQTYSSLGKSVIKTVPIERSRS